MLLLGGFGLVVEDVQEACAQLQEIDVAGDGVVPERERKAAGLEIGKVIGGQIDWDLDRNGGGIIEQHKALECLMAFDVVGRNL